MTRPSSRALTGAEIEAATGWEFRPIEHASERFAAKLRAQALEEEQSRHVQERQAGLAEGHAKGHAAGYAEGFTQGHAQATLEGQRLITEHIEGQARTVTENFASIFESAQTQLAAQEQIMARGVLDLACELARQVVRHELSSNPNALQPVVREALSMLSLDCKAALVRLNPVDAEVMADMFAAEFPHLTLSLHPDSSITRGGCLVEAAGTVVDATVEKRWMRALANLGLESAWEVQGDDGIE